MKDLLEKEKQSFLSAQSREVEELERKIKELKKKDFAQGSPITELEEKNKEHEKIIRNSKKVIERVEFYVSEMSILEREKEKIEPRLRNNKVYIDDFRICPKCNEKVYLDAKRKKEAEKDIQLDETQIKKIQKDIKALGEKYQKEIGSEYASYRNVKSNSNSQITVNERNIRLNTESIYKKKGEKERVETEIKHLVASKETASKKVYEEERFLKKISDSETKVNNLEYEKKVLMKKNR